MRLYRGIRPESYGYHVADNVMRSMVIAWHNGYLRWIRVKKMGEKKERQMSPGSIFLRFLKIGMIGFGGGSALIPVVEKEIVGEGKPISEEAYVKHTVIANITPGALPVKLGATCGYQMGGAAGSLAGAYGVMLPGVLLTVLILSLFSVMGAEAITLFSYASVGISIFIIMLLCHYIGRICGRGEVVLNCAICAASFLLTCGKEIRQVLDLLLPNLHILETQPLFNISTIDLMIVAFLMILFYVLKKKRWELVTAALLCLLYTLAKGNWGGETGIVIIAAPVLAILIGWIAIKLVIAQMKKEHVRQKQKNGQKQFSSSVLLLHLVIPVGLVALVAVCFTMAVLPFFGNVALSTVTSFGGGEAYVSVADGFFVQNGVLSADAYYTSLVPVANALPGPILVKIAAGAGYLFGSGAANEVVAGWFCAMAAAAVATGVCCAIALLVLRLYEAVEHSAFIVALNRFILPVICGMLLSTVCSMLYEAMRINESKGIPALPALVVMAAWVAALGFLRKKFRIRDAILLAGSAAVSFVGLLVL